MKILNKNEFYDLVINSKGKVLIDFFATWCGPCQMLSPILEELNNKIDNVSIYKVDVDKETELAKSYKVTSVPFMILFIDGKPIQCMLGYQPKEIIKDWLLK